DVGDGLGVSRCSGAREAKLLFTLGAHATTLRAFTVTVAAVPLTSSTTTDGSGAATASPNSFAPSGYGASSPVICDSSASTSAAPGKRRAQRLGPSGRQQLAQRQPEQVQAAAAIQGLQRPLLGRRVRELAVEAVALSDAGAHRRERDAEVGELHLTEPRHEHV